jgi:DNA-binding NtrC family response regulator
MDNSTKILVIDDDENIRLTLAAILKDEGYFVDVAMTGKEAIQKSETTVYNLALIDIRLPDMEGTDLLGRMKEAVPKMRKVIVTGYPSVQNAIGALNKQADAYILKPVEIDKLLNTIKAQLQIQEDENKYSEQKVAEFIETRVKVLQETR